MLRIRELNVVKAGKLICRVDKLDVAEGERVAVIGSNGSGKTTLLRVISGLEAEFAGTCEVDVRKDQRVYLHQLPYLFRGSVLFNAAYGLAARGFARRESHRRAHEWLEIFGVEHLAHRRCGRLSGGERRRVALARAFAAQPSLMLLDEPFAELDQQGVHLVCHALGLMPRTTVVISSPGDLPADLPVRIHAMRNTPSPSTHSRTV